MIDNIKWLGHSSVRIEKEGRYMYIDPWKLKDFSKKADVVLITHSHNDHCSPEDIALLLKEGTVVIGPSDALQKIRRGDKKTLLPGGNLDMGWVTIKGTPAYNIDKKFHPKSNNWLGYLLTFKDVSIYITGDTDVIPEMKNIKTDIVVLPVGGTYTMDAQQAATAVNTIKPKFAIPIHFGDIVGSSQDARTFASMVKGAEVKILEISK